MKPDSRNSTAPIKTTRRKFLESAASVGAVSIGFPNILLGESPSETLNVACVGVGGMAGGAGVRHVDTNKNARVVALCDVDSNILGGQARKHPDAKTFRDYRKMLEAMPDDIDAVTIGTPDHMHAPIAMAAMDLGKHVYCEKPLAHRISEVRAMTKMAQEKGVVTQIGTQIHSYSEYRSAVAAIRSGAIGKVSEVHLWISNSWAGPPETRPDKTDPVPSYLEWELWLGEAPSRPYVHKLYLPHEWRRWKDFGGGTLGDMGCHLMDPIFTALEISTPTWVQSTGPENFEETFAPNSRIEYEFAGTDRTTGPLKMTWAERMAPTEAAKKHLPPDGRLPKQGAVVIGEKGMMIIPHFAYASIYQDGKLINGKVGGVGAVTHAHEWHNACRGEGESSTPFSFSGPMTEAVLLGVVASNFKDQKLQWDSKAMRFSNSAEATALV